MSSLALLQSQKKQAEAEKAQLEARLASDDMLSLEDQQQLQEVEERLEALDMEMEYKAESIAQLQQSLVQQQCADDESAAEAGLRGLDALLAAADGRGDKGENVGGRKSWDIPEGESKELLQECLKRVLLLEEVARKRDKEREALEAEATGRREEASALQKALERLHLETQRDMAEKERRHQQDLQVLLRREGLNSTLDKWDSHSLVSVAAAADGEGERVEGAVDEERVEVEKKLGLLQEQVGMLDKDNFYYKQSNSNLKRRLRELTAAGEQEREKIEKLESEEDLIKKRNAALEEELSNLKKFLAVTVPGAAPVRISRQELRPLTPADVASLRASASNATHPTRVGIELQGASPNRPSSAAQLHTRPR